ncbi:Hypothetical predicted protein, partial [Paramuricea clavata]
FESINQLAYSRNDPGEVNTCFSAILLLVGGGFNTKCAIISGLICDSYKLYDGNNKLKAI